MILSDLTQKLADQQETIRLLQKELEETNSGLVALTLELEQRVDERTAQLREAHGELQRTNSELLQLTLELEERVAQRTELLRASEARYCELFENANDVVFTTDLGGNFTSLNKAAERVSGYPCKEALRMNIAQIFAPEHVQSMRAGLERLIAGGSPEVMELEIVTKNNLRVALEVSFRLVCQDGKPVGAQSIARDITERKRAKMELDWMASFPKLNPNPIVEVDRAGSVSFLNPVAERLFPDLRRRGLTHPWLAAWEELEQVCRTSETMMCRREMLVGEAWYQQIVHYVPAIERLRIYGFDITQRKRAEEALRRSEANYRSLIQGATYGIFRCRVDGKFLTVNPALISMLGYHSEAELLAANLVTDINPDSDKGAQLLRQYRQAGRLDGVEVEWKRKDGTLIAVRLSGRVISGEPGAAECFEVIAEDLGERKHLEEQLRQAQKMETVGRLAGGIAHDFNNLLTIISGFSQLLLERLEADDPRRAYVKEIQGAEERAASLTRQLLAFGRRQVLLPQVLDLNVIVAKMDKMLRPLLGEDIELVIVLPPDLGRVKADPGQIEQVLLNLAVNARDAMPGGGKLTLETADADLDEAYALSHAVVKTGPYVVLAVSDTGCGMDAETQRHIFEPFFTTKEKEKGTGLGLAMAYGIVKQSEGYIWVYSEPGQGTTFKIYLPRVQEAAELVAVNQAQAGPAVGSETILLVEDEASVRLLVRGLLGARGYTVLEAGRADEALLICQQHPGPIHLLLTDVVMPQMMGPALAESLQLLRPTLKVLYMSGYTDHAVFHNGTLQAGTSFIQKPFTPATLAENVRKVLDEVQTTKTGA